MNKTNRVEGTIRHTVGERKGDGFTMIPHDMTNDSSLSLAAKGLLLYMLSKPDGWKLRVADVAKRCNNGEASIRSALKELRMTGYAHYARPAHVGEPGVWRFCDWPEFAVIAETAMTETVMTETATLSKNEDSNTEGSKKDLSKKTKETGKPDAAALNSNLSEIPKTSIEDSLPSKAKRHFVPPVIRYTRQQVNDAVESQGCVNIINHKPQLFEELKAFQFRDRYGNPIRNLDGYVNGLEFKIESAKSAKFRR